MGCLKFGFDESMLIVILTYRGRTCVGRRWLVALAPVHRVCVFSDGQDPHCFRPSQMVSSYFGCPSRLPMASPVPLLALSLTRVQPRRDRRNSGASRHSSGASDRLIRQRACAKRHAFIKCRATTNEIYDLAWSPDGAHLIVGCTDNVARIYDAATGACIKAIAEHTHYVQGVAWDPLNEFVATQSSDRCV